MVLASSADSFVLCRSMQRTNQEKLESRLESLDEKLEQTSKTQETSITQLKSIFESSIA
jgi:hypothetical protein